MSALEVPVNGARYVCNGYRVTVFCMDGSRVFVVPLISDRAIYIPLATFLENYRRDDL